MYQLIRQSSIYFTASSDEYDRYGELNSVGVQDFARNSPFKTVSLQSTNPLETLPERTIQSKSTYKLYSKNHLAATAPSFLESHATHKTEPLLQQIFKAMNLQTYDNFGRIHEDANIGEAHANFRNGGHFHANIFGDMPFSHVTSENQHSLVSNSELQKLSRISNKVDTSNPYPGYEIPLLDTYSPSASVPLSKQIAQVRETHGTNNVLTNADASWGHNFGHSGYGGIANSKVLHNDYSSHALTSLGQHTLMSSLQRPKPSRIADQINTSNPHTYGPSASKTVPVIKKIKPITETYGNNNGLTNTNSYLGHTHSRLGSQARVHVLDDTSNSNATTNDGQGSMSLKQQLKPSGTKDKIYNSNTYTQYVTSLLDKYRPSASETAPLMKRITPFTETYGSNNGLTNADANLGNAQAYSKHGGQAHANVLGDTSFSRAATSDGEHGSMSYADPLFGHTIKQTIHWRKRRSILLSKI